MSVTVFGIRHHGPGSARSLRAALQDLEPDIVLVEGPPEGTDLLRHVAEKDMQPPVALLVYRPDQPRRAAFYPFAVFSPEWQAILYALGHAIPVRLCDLPQAVQLAMAPAEREDRDTEPPPPSEALDQRIRADPLRVLAEAAGYQDSELWWEEHVERRADARGLFEAILEAMSALRADTGIRDEREAQREAHMRQAIRQAEREGFRRIAVVCGAWHAPALHERPSARADAALLAGLPRVTVSATWVPWTNFRLSYHSGYGAGLTSPGWYAHLWTSEGDITAGWIAQAARLLRHERLEAPASGVIDAVRLSDTLAALRGRPQPGLPELRESIQTVLCAGQAAPLQLIRQQLEIGDLMGTVPAGVPMVPLQADVERQQRRLRLRPLEEHQTLDLDLRRDLGRQRSVLLHRLRLLGIPWGKIRDQQAGRQARRRGTFHELWQLQWQVEFVLLMVERNAFGNTLLDAGEAFALEQAAAADLPRLTELLRDATLAELPGAIAALLQHVQAQGAVAGDVRHLLDAIPPLTQIVRYGDVRGTPTEQILPIVSGFFARAVIGLPGACHALDDAAAGEMVTSMAGVEESLGLLDDTQMHGEWRDLLQRLAENDDIHPLVRGWCCRRAFEAGTLDGSRLARLARLALSPVTPAGGAAAWLEGLLRGSGLVLLHQDGLWRALDAWLQTLDAETFAATLPLLRRAFAGFQLPERRAMGEKVQRLRGDAGEAVPTLEEPQPAAIDPARARLLLPVLAHILGGNVHVA